MTYGEPLLRAYSAVPSGPARISHGPLNAIRNELVTSFQTRCNAHRAIISAECGLGSSGGYKVSPVALERDLVDGNFDHVLSGDTAKASARRAIRLTASHRTPRRRYLFEAVVWQLVTVIASRLTRGGNDVG